MSRKTNINKHFDENVWEKVNKENKYLMDDFISYLHSTDRADTTIRGYKLDLQGFFCWFYNNCKNKEFYDISKKDIMRYQGYLLNELNLGSSRIKRLKAVLSSLSNYIIKMLDDEYPEFKNIINLLDSPQNNFVREKTILSEEELNRLLDELVKQERYKEACYFAVLASSGVRKSEASRLKVQEFSDENILSNAVYKTKPIKTKGRGKKGKMLNKYFLISILEPYLSLWLRQREELGIENEYLFADRKRTLKETSADYWCERATKILEKDVYSHSLRHYLTSYMSKHNVPSKIIKEYFGWANIDMIDLYDDTQAEDSFSEYFTKDGIKQTESKDINNL